MKEKGIDSGVMVVTQSVGFHEPEKKRIEYCHLNKYRTLDATNTLQSKNLFLI